MRLTRLIPILILMLLLPILAGCTRTARSSSPPPDQPSNPNAQQVSVELSEWHVKLAPSTVKAGTVEFNVRNAGTIEHGFVVEGNGIRKAVQFMNPRDTTTLTVDLTPGSYTTYCPIDNHRGMGMMATLTVQ